MNKNILTDTEGHNTFEVVNNLPLGYHIWHIGKHMPVGYIPLCKYKAKQPFEGCTEIEPDTLKAISLENAERILSKVEAEGKKIERTSLLGEVKEYFNKLRQKKIWSNSLIANLVHQLYNLKPKAFYADGNWDLYKEGYNDCINDVIDLFEKAESCNEKSDVKNKSDTSCSKGVSLIPCNASDMEKINKFEKAALNENDVIILTFVLADNEIDTNNEQLCSSTLCELSHLFEGVNGTVHLSKSEINSRIFECYVDIVDGNQTRNGEQYCRLIARAYVKKFLLSDNDIKEISNATFNESTLGAAVSERICGICGNPVGKCNHNDYTKLLNATDAYEWNLFKKEN